ncbi:CopM family metallochaperone [Microvirga antarctica]|uniref:CopM family metallochaperone n=1 Tax=Microvirga antarctica TaxID=2819233 RepID=UPI001B312BE6|nr:DUF305 domain-containing protein [Microvirga antarctica]
MNRLTLICGLGFLCLSAPAPALAQQPNPHAGHGAAPAAADSPSTTAFQAANARMHAGMAIPFSGDADVDFARGMIPHHQGAVDMARIELEHGKDPALKKLAREIVAAQEKEISFLRNWLKAKGL